MRSEPDSMIGPRHARRGRRTYPPRRRSRPNRSRRPPGRCRPPAARRSTCTIIGTPAISASGLPGSRVEAMRAGMRMRTSGIRGTCLSPRRLYGLQDARQTGYLCSRPPLAPSRCGALRRWIRSNSIRFSAPCWEPACSCLPSTSPPARSSRRATPAKPGYDIAVKEERRRRRRQPRPRKCRSQQLLASASPQPASRPPRSA